MARAVITAPRALATRTPIISASATVGTPIGLLLALTREITVSGSGRPLAVRTPIT